MEIYRGKITRNVCRDAWQVRKTGQRNSVLISWNCSHANKSASTLWPADIDVSGKG